MAKTIKRLLELEAQLKYHDYMYFDQDKPVISDDEYELLSHEYHSLRAEFPDYTSDYTMGFVRPDPLMEAVPIVNPMLSIVKKKTKSDFNAWIKANIKSDKVYEDKLDGMAIRLIYQDGELSRIHTRGLGDVGADLSHRRHLLLNVPDVIEADVNKGRTEYTGEAFCLYSDFDAYIKKHGLDPEDTDPRSTVSGLMKRHKATDRDDLPIHFKVYAASPNVRKEFDSYLTLRKYFVSVGFDVPKLIPGEEINEWLDLTTKPIEEYPIDGIVVKDNDLRAWDKEQGNQYWTYAACFKFPTISLETQCAAIDWSLKLDGELVGTLIYNPVQYDGTTMTRCKLDYAQSYFDKGLGVGAVIKVTKSNEIIPRLVALVKPSPPEHRFKYPEKCPFCDHVLSTNTDAGTVKCVNESCEGQLVKQLIRLTDRKTGLDIRGLGDKRIQLLIDHGMLSEPGDLFKLTTENLVSVGIPESLAAASIGEIISANDLDLHRWLSALCIPGLGIVRAIELSNYSAMNGLNDGLRFHDVNDLVTIMSDATFLNQLFGLDGVVIATHVKKNVESITSFLSNYDFKRSRAPALNGIPIAITGSWNAMTRDMLTDNLAEAGFILSDKTTKTCKMLLTGDKPSPAKIEKAQRWNIPVINITGFHSVADIVALISK